MNHVGDSTGRKGMGDAGPHCRLRMITQPAVAYPKHRKTSGGRVRGSAMANRPQDDGPENRPPPRSDAARQLVVVAGARWMGAFNGGQRSGLRRRGACVEMRAGNATEGGLRIVDWTPGTGDQTPAIVRGRTID